jgi:hypothetical protein
VKKFATDSLSEDVTHLTEVRKEEEGRRKINSPLPISND